MIALAESMPISIFHAKGVEDVFVTGDVAKFTCNVKKLQNLNGRLIRSGFIRRSQTVRQPSPLLILTTLSCLNIEIGGTN